MSAIVQVTKAGPRSYTPAETVIGGQLVEARAAGRVGVASAGSFKVLGVALTDGTNPEMVAAFLSPLVGVAYGGIEVPVTYSGSAAFGDKLVAAAFGRVTPAGPTPDARALVGTCTAPAGVAAGAVGLMRTA